MRHTFVLMSLFGVFSTTPLQADFQWTASQWSATPTITGLEPGYSSASINIGGVSTDLLQTHFSVSAGQPPSGPGGPFVTATVTFSRSFRITEDLPGQPVPVTFRNTRTGTLNISGTGTHGAGYRVAANVSDGGAPIPLSFNVDNLFNSTPMTLNDDLLSTLNLPAGNYVLGGTLDASAYRLSGIPTSANIDLNIGVVPEPGLWAGLIVLLSTLVLQNHRKSA